MGSNLNKLIYTFSVLTLTTFFINSSVFADEHMSQKKIKSLLINKTIYSEHLFKDLQFKIFFDADGRTAYRTRKGDVIKTTYKFKGDKHCIYWNGDDRCAFIINNGDGSFTRVNNDKKIMKWYKVVNGKHLQ